MHGVFGGVKIFGEAGNRIRSESSRYCLRREIMNQISILNRHSHSMLTEDIGPAGC